MRARNLEERINAAFPDPAGESAFPDYLETIRANWRSAEDILRRTTLGLVITALLFELVASASVTEVTLGFFNVSDLSLIRKALPVVFAYLISEWLALGVLINRLGNVHDSTVKRLFPQIHNELLHIPLAPAVMSLAAEQRLVGTVGRAHTWIRALNRVKTTTFVVLLASAQIYFFYSNFNAYGIGDLTVWGALLISIAFLISTPIFARLFAKDPTWS